MAASQTSVFFTRCANEWAGPCTLHRYDRIPATPTLNDLGTIPNFELAGSMVLWGSELYVLTGRSLLRYPAQGGAPTVVFTGGPLPQHPGTLMQKSLRRVGNTLRFGSVCHFDADAPGYGTMDLDPIAATARWMNVDPAFPMIEGLAPYMNYEQMPVTNAHGLYLMHATP